jgi:hypothetical protein
MTDHASALWGEVTFRKSSYSGSAGGNCVEVARFETAWGVRDSKNSIGPVLAVSAQQGLAFLHAIKSDKISK